MPFNFLLYYLCIEMFFLWRSLPFGFLFTFQHECILPFHFDALECELCLQLYLLLLLPDCKKQRAVAGKVDECNEKNDTG